MEETGWATQPGPMENKTNRGEVSKQGVLRQISVWACYTIINLAHTNIKGTTTLKIKAERLSSSHMNLPLLSHSSCSVLPCFNVNSFLSKKINRSFLIHIIMLTTEQTITTNQTFISHAHSYFSKQKQWSLSHCSSSYGYLKSTL